MLLTVATAFCEHSYFYINFMILISKTNVALRFHRVQIVILNFTSAKIGSKRYLPVIADQCRSQNLSEDAPELLQAGCGELHRLLPLLE